MVTVCVVPPQTNEFALSVVDAPVEVALVTRVCPVPVMACGLEPGVVNGSIGLEAVAPSTRESGRSSDSTALDGADDWPVVGAESVLRLTFWVGVALGAVVVPSMVASVVDFIAKLEAHPIVPTCCTGVESKLAVPPANITWTQNNVLSPAQSLYRQVSHVLQQNAAE